MNQTLWFRWRLLSFPCFVDKDTGDWDDEEDKDDEEDRDEEDRDDDDGYCEAGQWHRNVIHGENELNAAAGGGRETTIRF